MNRSPSRFYDRVVLAVVALVPWLIQPGRVQPDTKVDLTLDLWGYLGRALSAWNPHTGLGEIQNQAYGYLFPMGPVFGLGDLIGLPAWAVQRVWWTLLVVVAFTGARALIRRWGLAGPTASMVGAAAYAFSPRVLTLLSDHSVEAWPGAVAPWLLLVATDLATPDSSRRDRLATGCRVGLLVAALGGVNATASAVAVLPAFLSLAVHPVGRRRLPLLFAAVLLGALWWVLPLLILGAYAYPFLDYIETASITTAVTSVPNSLRGADNWIAYILDDQSHPSWQGGWVIAQGLSAIVLTSLVAGLGMIGLLRTAGHVRRFGLVSLVLGTLAMVIGHPGFAGGPFAATVRSLLDGPLVVFRNVHKFDLLVRLPLSLGLAVLAGTLAHRAGRPLLERRLAAGGVALLVLAAMVPLWQGRAGSDASYRQVPASWRSAAATVDRLDASGGAALLLPSSRTASYTWGRSTDEPLAALADTPVVVRASAPLGHPAATRALDAIDALAASGRAQPSLAPSLARIGLRTVVVRRDLAANAGAGPWRSVEATLAASPGITAVEGQRDAHRSIWRVDAGAPEVTRRTVVLAGGPEAIPAAIATGAVAPDTALVLATDQRRPPELVTDSLAWRSYNNGAPAQRAYGPVLPATDDAPTRPGSRALPPVLAASARPHRELIGLTDITASSSAADPFAKAYLSVAHSQFAAIDGDPGTSWLSGDHEAAATLDLRLAAPARGGFLSLLLATGKGITRPDTVEVNGTGLRPSGASVQVPVAAGTTRLRITLRADYTPDPVMGLAQVTLAGTPLGSVIDVPTPVDVRTGALLLGAEPAVPGVPSRDGEDGAQFRRRVAFATSGTAPLTVWLRSVPGSAGQDCGGAGSITVGGTRTPLRFAGAADSGLRKAVPCGTAQVAVPAGRVDLTVSPAGSARVAHLLLGAPPQGTAQSLATTTHGANAGWAATQAGKTLVGQTVDGWRQAYLVHADTTSAPVIERFAPTRWHRIGLAVGAVAVLLLAVGAWITRRCRPRLDLGDAGTAPNARSGWSAPVIAAAVGGLVAGPAGVLLGACTFGVPRRFRAELACAAMLLAGVALAFGGVVDARSWGAGAGQLLGTVSLVLLAAELPYRRPPADSPNGPAQDAR